MSSINELSDYCKRTGLRLGGVFLGTNQASAEEVAASILASLMELESRFAKGRPHECPDWDGLTIFPGDPEMDGCTCEGVDR